RTGESHVARYGRVTRTQSAALGLAERIVGGVAAEWVLGTHEFAARRVLASGGTGGDRIAVRRRNAQTGAGVATRATTAAAAIRTDVDTPPSGAVFARPAVAGREAQVAGDGRVTRAQSAALGLADRVIGGIAAERILRTHQITACAVLAAGRTSPEGVA